MTKILVRFVKFRMTDNLEIHKVKERIKMNNTKQTQDDRTVQPFNRSTIQRVKAYAFTLAETLIVIGIIGVVAALTLPNLNHATGDKEKVTRVKKMYSALAEAVDRAEAIYGPYDEWFINDENDPRTKAKRAGERITEFMKISKTCEPEEEGCFGKDSKLYDYDFYRVVTADGTSIAFALSDGIIVDIDGPNKGNSTDGKDWFAFFYKKTDSGTYNLMPEGYDIPFGTTINCAKVKRYDLCGMTAWIINYDNMDYLKIDSDGKCPNGTTPTESNPRCN